MCPHVDAAGTPYSPAVAVDVVTKLGHLASSGSASQELQPHLSHYFGATESAVKQLHAAGQLNSLKEYMAARTSGQQPAEGQQAGSMHGEEDYDQPQLCTSALSCARHQSKSTTAYDINGVIGAVCSHGAPVRGTFANLPTPENFVYYMEVLLHLVRRCPSVRDVYIDFGCRLSGSWQRLIEKLGTDVPGEAKQLRVMVNWLHASSHDFACQISNSGRFKAGAAWTVGEMIEQLWAQTKVRPV